MRWFAGLASVFLLALTPVPAAALPIAPAGTEGLAVIVGGRAVFATYRGNTAHYSNDLYLLLDSNGMPGDDGILSNDLFIFNNKTSALGASVSLGNFAPGTELMFRLHVNDTGMDYYTGPPIRNVDNQAHARVQQDYLEGATLVSFEDLFGIPEGPLGYNDLSFSFSNTSNGVTAAQTAAVPEPASVLLLAAGALLAVRRRRR